MRATSLLSLLAGAAAIAAAPLESRQSNVNTTAEPCARLSGDEFKPSQIEACLKSVPFSEAVRDNVMGAVTAMYTVAIFQYNQLGDSDPVLNQGVDITKEFQRINSTKYSSDYDFQRDLSNVMRSLNDGHHAWSNCYDKVFTTQHALQIVPLRDGSSTNIYIAPDLETFAAGSGLANLYATTYDLNVTALAGAQVLSIDGQDPMSYLTSSVVPHAGTYQDPQQRLNSVFASYLVVEGEFGRRAGQFSATTSLMSDNFTMSVQTANGEKQDLTVPWITTWTGSSNFAFANGTELFETICLPHSSTASSASSSPTPSTSGQNSTSPTNDTSSSPQTFDEIVQYVYTACPVVSDARYPFITTPPTKTSSYVGGRDIQFYNLGSGNSSSANGSDVGVIYVSTFDFSSDVDTSACSARFVVDAYLGLQNLSRAGVDRVLVDTSNNGGGSVALTQYLQRLMTGQRFLPENNFETVLRRAPLAEALLDLHLANASTYPSGSYAPDQFRNGTSLMDLANSTDFFEPGSQRTINGQTLLLSNQIEDSLDGTLEYAQTLNLTDVAPFPPMDIVFTGNGLCGSACSSFTNFLIEYYNATGYVSSAQPDKPIEFQAFAAGQATTSAEIYKEAAGLNFTDAALLPQLEVVGTFAFALRAALSPRVAPGEFLQYRTYPAKGSYTQTLEQYLDPLESWKYVASQVWK